MIFDFTNGEGFGDKFVEWIRKEKPKKIAVVDRVVAGGVKGPALVRDHLNLTGHSPLCGPNHECGERFPVVQGIYVEDALPELPRVVAAGVVSGSAPSKEDMKVLGELGAEVACCNLVQAMIVAAHAKCQVVGVVVPDKLTPELASKLKALVGEK